MDSTFYYEHCQYASARPPPPQHSETRITETIDCIDDTHISQNAAVHAPSPAVSYTIHTPGAACVVDLADALCLCLCLRSVFLHAAVLVLAGALLFSLPASFSHHANAVAPNGAYRALPFHSWGALRTSDFLSTDAIKARGYAPLYPLPERPMCVGAQVSPLCLYVGATYLTVICRP